MRSLSFSLFLAAALLVLAPSHGRSAPANLTEHAGDRVVDIDFVGDGISEAVRAKFLHLKGRPFQAAELRGLLNWAHETGLEWLLQVSLEPRAGGVRLVVTSRQKRRITEVKFEGNRAVSENALLPVVEIKEGYEFEKEAAEEAVRKIGLFYSKQGYLATDISYSFEAETGRLRFRIQEGDPTLISSLAVSPLAVIERKELRARYESDILDAFGLKVGDRIQRDRVLEGIQSVKDWLRDHDFLMARDPQLEYKVDEQGQVAILLNIQYGSRIRFGFRGNTHFSYRELMAMVGEIKEVSSGSDYLASVRRRVMEAYREIGLANAQISTLVREDPARGVRQVSLIVNEGQKIKIDRIVIEGVYSLPQDDAVAKFSSLATRLVQRGFFDEQGINKAADLFAEYLKSRGYLSAKVELVKFDFNEPHTRATVSLLFNEGIQTRVQDVKISGASAISEADILGYLGLKVGEPFDIFAFERGLILVKDRYQEIGHLSAQIANEASDRIVRYSRDNGQVSIELELDEGPVYKVGEVAVRGNQKTHARVVLRELPFIPGDILTQPLLNEAEGYIRRLNLFSSVILRAVDRPGTTDVKDLLILVEETDAGSFDIVPGFRNDLGLRLGFEFGYQNLGGWNRSVNARAVFNRRLSKDYKFPEYSFFFGFREPYLANWPVVFTSNLSLFRQQFPSFDATVSRLMVGGRRDIASFLNGFVEYSLERVRIANVDPRSGYVKSDERLDLIGAVTPGLVFDTRNDPYNPTRGFQSANRFEIASHLFGSKDSVGYYRITSQNSAYVNVFDGAVLAMAFNLGWERSNVLGERIPIFKLFRLGGIGSVRGYGEDEIQVEKTDTGTAKDILGVLGSVNARSELRIPLMGSWGTAVFLDAGNLYIDRLSFNPATLRSSVGAGLRYITAVGPVLIDFAWKLQKADQVGDTVVKDSARERMRIHLSIGSF